MTDPRNTDPRETLLPQSGGPAGWIVGIAAVVLITVAKFAGAHHATHPPSDKPLATTESALNGAIEPPSTTGFGGSSPQPMSPPARSGQ